MYKIVRIHWCVIYNSKKKINDKMSVLVNWVNWVCLGSLSTLFGSENSYSKVTQASLLPLRPYRSSLPTSRVPLTPLHQFHSFTSHIRLRFLEMMKLWIPGASVMEWHIENIINNAKKHSNTLGIMLGIFHMIIHLMFTKILCFRYFYHFHYKGEKTRISS